MKATIAHTSEGRTKILIDEYSENIERFFTNLDGKKYDGFWIFQRSDARYAIESLEEEGYTTAIHQLV